MIKLQNFARNRWREGFRVEGLGFRTLQETDGGKGEDP